MPPQRPFHLLSPLHFQLLAPAPVYICSAIVNKDLPPPGPLQRLLTSVWAPPPFAFSSTLVGVGSDSPTVLGLEAPHHCALMLSALGVFPWPCGKAFHEGTKLGPEEGWSHACPAG